MKQEELHQNIRENNIVLVLTARLKNQVLDRAQRLIDGVEYVPIRELLREINEITKLLLGYAKRPQEYAVAISAEVARRVLLALLLIPHRQRAMDGDDHPMNSLEAAKEIEETIDDALGAAHRLWGTEDALPTIEDWAREKSGARHPEFLERLITSRRDEEVPLHTAMGSALLRLPPAPKALPSGDRQRVDVAVKTVDEDQGIAWVRVTAAAKPEGPAMNGLFDRRVPLKFDEGFLPGIAKLLELAQVTDVPIAARVHVFRGIGPSGAKHDKLEIKEVVDETATRRKIGARLVEMQAVTQDIGLIEEVGAPA